MINFDDTIVLKNQSKGPTAAKFLSRLNCSNIEPPESRPLICLHRTGIYTRTVTSACASLDFYTRRLPLALHSEKLQNFASKNRNNNNFAAKSSSEHLCTRVARNDGHTEQQHTSSARLRSSFEQSRQPSKLYSEVRQFFAR